MKPDRTNYEIWITDYLDGRLDEDEVRLLRKFLEANPDIMKEAEALLNFRIIPPEVTFPGKKDLKKSPSDMHDEQFDILCIASLENDLSPEEEVELQQIIAENPGRLKSYNLIKKLKLTPPAIKYPAKYRLRRPGITVRTVRYTIFTLAAAASVMLLITLLQPKESLPTTNTAISSARETLLQRVPAPDVKEETPVIIPVPEKNKQLLNVTKPAVAYLASLPDRDTSALLEQGAPVSEPSGVTHEIIAITPAEFKTTLISYSRTYTPAEIRIKDAGSDLFSGESPTGLKYALTRFVREKILKNEAKADGELKVYELAEVGINGINKLLGWEMALNETTGEYGQPVALNFNSKLVKFNIPVKKNEPGQ